MGQLSELHGRLLRLKLEARALLSETEAIEEGAAPRGALESRALADATENLWRVLDALHGKANFNPDQPRVPRGNPDGGQWTEDAVYGGAASLFDADEELGGRYRREDSERQFEPEHPIILAGVGHHYVPVSIFKKLPLRPETRKVLDKATTGPLIERHQNSKEHFIYNELVRERLVEYATRKRIRFEDMTPQHAEEFVSEIISPPDEVGRFNRKIRRLEKILRFMQRGIR